MADELAVWTETDSTAFLDLANIAVPSRREQADVLLSLVPARPDEAFSAVELACGEGLLSERLLQRFPQLRLVALDRSPLMLEHASGRLAPYGERACVLPFELGDFAWLGQLPSPLRCVLSSLAVHHLDDEGKRRLFREVSAGLEPGGALLIADVTEPASQTVRDAVSSAWHSIAREQSLAGTGATEAYERAVRDGWAPPTSGDPVPGEMPARLFQQLKWLEDAGFSVADCFWMRAGIAIFGGYR